MNDKSGVKKAPSADKPAQSELFKKLLDLGFEVKKESAGWYANEIPAKGNRRFGPADTVALLYEKVVAGETSAQDDTAEAWAAKDGEKEDVSVKTPSGGKVVRLPGAEDPALEDIENQAMIVVEARDEMQASNAAYCTEKDKLLGLMHKHKRTTYSHRGVIVEITVEKEKLTVKAPKKAE